MAGEKIRNPNKIIETTSIRNGKTENVEEFWSAESLRERSIYEQYPKLEKDPKNNDKPETDAEYNDRIQNIRDEIVKQRIKQQLIEQIKEQHPKLENETNAKYNDRIQNIWNDGEYDERVQSIWNNMTNEDKRKIEEDKPVERHSREANPDYKKFGLSALRTFDMAEKNSKLLYSDEGKNQKELDQALINKANYYINLYQNNQPELSEFGESEKKLKRDQSRMQKKEDRIESKKELDPALRVLEEERGTWDRLAEVVLYPLALNFGLFDYNYYAPTPKEVEFDPNYDVRTPEGAKHKLHCRARAIYISRHDDLNHGVDAAFMIPVSKNELGEIKYAPVSFDCTTSGSGEIIRGKFDKVGDDGCTDMEYAKTEDGDLISNTRLFNFIVGVDHDALKELMRMDNITRNPEALEKSKKGNDITYNPKAFMHDICAQIYQQARLASLQIERNVSKDTLSEDELKALKLRWREAIAVRDFFGQKTKELATDKNHPFNLSYRNYKGDKPAFLVYNEALERLRGL